MRRFVLLIASAMAAITLGVAGGQALAYFTTMGSGSGSASAASGSHILSVVAVVAGTPQGSLRPGGTGDIVLRVRNDNTTPVTIIGLSQNGRIVVTGGGSCTADNAAVAIVPSSTLSIQIAASTTTDVHIEGGAAMGLNSANTCQGAAFDIPVLLEVAG